MRISAAKARIIVIADGTPDRELLTALTALAGQSEITLHVDAVNRGYPGAANIGIRMAAGHDVILAARRYHRHAWLACWASCSRLQRSRHRHGNPAV